MSLRDKYTDEEWDELEARLAFGQPFSKKKSSIKPEYQRVEIHSDGDGHDYVIPYDLNLVDKFYDLLENENDIEEFEELFDKYRCGGDPFGEYEFYIKKR